MMGLGRVSVDTRFSFEPALSHASATGQLDGHAPARHERHDFCRPGVMLVRDVMSRRVVFIDLDDTVEAIARVFRERGIHHAIVVDAEMRVAGVVSDRDVLKATSPFVTKLAERPMDLQTLRRPAHQLMSRQPVTIEPEASIGEAAQRMVDKRCSCLPVVDSHGRAVGIVTSRDVLRFVARATGSWRPTVPAASAD
jgi:acetoin utilization protein AcuB